MANWFLDGDNGVDAAARGTISLPWATIAYAQAQISSGDTVFMRAVGGPLIYDDNIVNGFPAGISISVRTRFAAYPGEEVWIAPSYAPGQALYLSGSTQIFLEFDGINFDGYTATGGTIVIQPYATNRPHDILIQNCEILGHDTVNSQGIVLDNQIDATALGNNIIRNCIIHRVYGPDFCHGIYAKSGGNIIEDCDIYDYPGGGVHLFASYTATGNIVRRNVIHDSRLNLAVPASLGRHWGVIVADYMVDTEVYLNIVYGMPYEAGDINYCCAFWDYTATGSDYYNNTAEGNDGGAIYGFDYSTDMTAQNNLAYNNGIDAISSNGVGTITIDNNLDDGTDPLFTDAGTHVYTLQAGSPAIGYSLVDRGYGFTVGAEVGALSSPVLTGHFDTAGPNVWTVNTASVYSVHPADGAATQYWDDPDTLFALIATSGPMAPLWKLSAPAMTHSCLAFNGVDQYYVLRGDDLTTMPTLVTFFQAAAFEMYGAALLASVATNHVDTYSNVAILSDSGLFVGIFARNTGSVIELLFFVWDGTPRTITIPITLASTFTFMFRLAGGLMYASVNNGPEFTTICGPIAGMTGVLELGRSFAGSHYADCSWGELVLVSGTSDQSSIDAENLALATYWLPATSAVKPWYAYAQQ